MNILIIGSKGFIGTHVSQYYQNNHRVIRCDVVTEYNEVDYIQIDATNSDFHSIFEKNNIDICINCSGAASVALSFENPLKDFNLNTHNVFKIVDAIRLYQPHCKFVNLSSAAVYGNPKQIPITEEGAYSPISPYGIHKMQAEQICKEFFELYNIQTCTLRIFSAYGEGLKKQLFWDLYQKFNSGNRIELFGTGTETRDFIYIEDIVHAIDCVIEKSSFDGNVINVANGEELTIQYIAEIFNKELGLDREIFFNNEVKPGDPLHWKADISKLKALGYHQKTAIESGIKKYVLWAKELK